jgi:hypothetical protein
MLLPVIDEYGDQAQCGFFWFNDLSEAAKQRALDECRAVFKDQARDSGDDPGEYDDDASVLAEIACRGYSFWSDGANTIW